MTVNQKVVGSSPTRRAMETTFKYQGKIITTPNLEKKLKRMNISMDDIEIIETPKKEVKEDNSLVYPLEWYRYYKNGNRWLCKISKEFVNTTTFLDKEWIYDDEHTKREFGKISNRSQH